MKPINQSLLFKSFSLSEQAILLNPKSKLGYVSLSEAFLTLKKYSKAMQIITIADLTSPTSSWRIKLQRLKIIFLETQDISILKKIIANSYLQKDIFDYQISTLIEKLENKDEILEILEILEESEYNSLGLNTQASIASYLIKIQRFSKARSILNKILNTKDNHLPALVLLARIIQETENKYTKSIAILKRSKDQIDEKKILLLKAYIKTNQNIKAHNLSLEIFKKDISFNHNTYAKIKDLYTQNNYYAEFIKLLDKLIFHNPDQYILYADKGNIYSKFLNNHLLGIRFLKNLFF